MTIVAELVTKLKTDNSQFNKGMNDAGTTAGKFAKNASVAFLGLATIVGVTLVASFIKLGDTILDTASSIDKMNDSAKALNIDFTQYQKLSAFAKQSGTSNDELSRSLKFLVKNLAAAESGNQKAADKFKALGISMDELKGKKVDEVFQLVANKIQELPTYTEQAGAAISLFGKNGTSILQTLTSDMTEFNANWQALGLGITQQQADIVAAFEDSKDTFALVWEDFKQQITVAAVPALQELIKWVLELVKSYGGLKPIALEIAESFVSGIQLIVSGFQNVLNFVDRVGLGLDKLHLKFLELKQQYDLFFSDIKFDVNFDDMDTMAKLRRDINQTEQRLQSGGVTSGLQEGLTAAKQTIQNQQQQNSAQQKVTVEVKADKENIIKAVINHEGLNATVNTAVKTVVAQEARGVFK